MVFIAVDKGEQSLLLFTIAEPVSFCRYLFRTDNSCVKLKIGRALLCSLCLFTILRRDAICFFRMTLILFSGLLLYLPPPSRQSSPILSVPPVNMELLIIVLYRDTKINLKIGYFVQPVPNNGQ